MDSLKIVEEVVRALSNKKAVNIMAIDVREKSSFADYLVLATGGSIRQLNALVDEVEDKIAKYDLMPRAIEGKQNSDWLLMDYVDVVVNVLTEDSREKYNIEKVWGYCDTLDVSEWI